MKFDFTGGTPTRPLRWRSNRARRVVLKREGRTLSTTVWTADRRANAPARFPRRLSSKLRRDRVTAATSCHVGSLQAIELVTRPARVGAPDHRGDRYQGSITGSAAGVSVVVFR